LGLDDLKLPIPKQIPAYIEDAEYEKLLATAGQKRSHKELITRLPPTTMPETVR
jgi:hypothetical protein